MYAGRVDAEFKPSFRRTLAGPSAGTRGTSGTRRPRRGRGHAGGAAHTISYVRPRGPIIFDSRIQDVCSGVATSCGGCGRSSRPATSDHRASPSADVVEPQSKKIEPYDRRSKSEVRPDGRAAAGPPRPADTPASARCWRAAGVYRGRRGVPVHISAFTRPGRAASSVSAASTGVNRATAVWDARRNPRTDRSCLKSARRPVETSTAQVRVERGASSTVADGVLGFATIEWAEVKSHAGDSGWGVELPLLSGGKPSCHQLLARLLYRTPPAPQPHPPRLSGSPPTRSAKRRRRCVFARPRRTSASSPGCARSLG